MTAGHVLPPYLCPTGVAGGRRAGGAQGSMAQLAQQLLAGKWHDMLHAVSACLALPLATAQLWGASVIDPACWLRLRQSNCSTSALPAA